MLKELYIKNIAVIDDLRLDFADGFHIFTGETGAGKSILVESIGLVLGEKAKAPLIRDGAAEALVEAVFDVSAFPEVRESIARESLTNPEDEGELVVKRSISADGKNKVFINHQRATLVLLQEIAALLIDYTGQHQQIELLDARQDIHVLDGFLTDPSLPESYREAFVAAQSTARELSTLKATIRQKDERLDWIAHQLKDWEGLEIDSEEAEKEWKLRRERLKNGAAYARFATVSDDVIMSAETSCVNGLGTLIREIEKQPCLVESFEVILKSLRDAKLCLEDIAYDIAKIAAKNDELSNPVAADRIESQLFQLEQLKRKFGPGVSEVFARREELLDEQAKLKNSGQELESLEKRFAAEFAVLRAKSDALSKARRGVSQKVQKAVLKELSELKMPEARFEIEVEPVADAGSFAFYGPHGTDRVAFLLSPNPGLALKPLAKIASGGETSRIFLAIKQVLTRFRSSGTLIFDEIDTGISGAAVELTGKKLKTLADRFQVFCITHHAQIASLADRHFLVSKEVQKGKTFTRVKVLSQDERIREVARLMGGVTISGKNLEFAREMVVTKTRP